MNIRLWMDGMRPRTLPASVAPVCVGASAALLERSRLLEQCTSSCSPSPVDPALKAATPGRLALIVVLLVLLALSMQIAANFANDYADGVRGTDSGRGGEEAASGRPRRLVAAGVPPRKVLYATMISAAFTCLMGLIVMALTGHWWMILVGVCCLIAGWCYVGGPHPYGYHGLGEVSVFIFFGLVATLGTEYFLIDRVDTAGILGACACGLNAVGLLMLNNYRDLDDDRRAGKHTYAVLVGARAAAISIYLVYILSLVLGLIQFVPAVMRRGLPGFPLVLILLPVAAVFLLICRAFARGQVPKAFGLAGKGTLVSALCWSAGLLLQL